MSALGLSQDDAERYRTLLGGSDQEFQALVDEVVVPESWFFRDVAPFALLRDRVKARQSAGHDAPPFRVLSVPCAGGEEPYSAAIALLEGGVPPNSFRIDAADVSRKALARAERAVYSDNAFRSAERGFRDRFFRPVPSGFALDPSVVALVRFRHANLLTPGLFEGEPPYDAIFCRNLLIYLDGPARDRALANVDRLLAPDGLLFVGHAEPLGILGDGFRAVGPRGSFAFERVPEATPSPPLAPSRKPDDAPTRPKRLRPPGQGLAGRSVAKTLGSTSERRESGRSDDTAGRDPSPVVSGGASRLRDASRMADEGRHQEAARLCEEEIEANGPSADAFFLLGMVRQASGDRARAELCFEKAVYLDARHEDALLALALLAQRRGDQAAAANYRRRAERAFREKPRA
jgi:chemotaxis protein methyltransferase WspC